MFSRLHFWPNLLNTTLRPDKEGHAKDPFILTTHEFFETPYPIGFANLLVFVRNQSEGQIMLGNEFAMLDFRITAYPQQNSVCLFKTSVFITERADFYRSARRVVFGIKKQNKVLALKILECRRAAAIGDGLKGRSFVPLL